MSFKLEICTPNIISVEAAVRAKADRIELCSALEVGGLTPSIALIKAASKQIETHVLIRPRSGDFNYLFSDIRLIQHDILSARKAGAKGVVIGLLNKKNMPHKHELKRILDGVTGLELTFHRAFDFCKEPFDALEMLIDLGFKRILTSGGANSAMEGRDLLRRLNERAAGRITIMPGSGITPENILEIQRETGCREFHAAAKKTYTSLNKTNITGLENNFTVSDADTIRNLKKALDFAI